MWACAFARPANTVRDGGDDKDVSTTLYLGARRGGSNDLLFAHHRPPAAGGAAPSKTASVARGSPSLPSRPERKSRMKSASHLLLARLNIEQLIDAAVGRMPRSWALPHLAQVSTWLVEHRATAHCLSSDRTRDVRRRRSAGYARTTSRHTGPRAQRPFRWRERSRWPQEMTLMAFCLDCRRLS